MSRAVGCRARKLRVQHSGAEEKKKTSPVEPPPQSQDPDDTDNMSSTGVIPRFLLPQRSAIWRTRLPTQSQSLRVRHASTKAPSKQSSSSDPLVLEKPAKFVPPSHGSKLRKEPPRYPGPDLTAEEKARMQSKKYPHMLPPKGTFMHWFLHNKSIHIYISLGTLFTMGATVFITNFKRDSPFADMIPPWTQFIFHPIRYTRTIFEIIKLHQDHVTAQTQERRKRKVEDVAKRSAYRKAHGLDKNEGFGGWTAKSDDELLGPAIPLGEGVRAGELVTEEVPTTDRAPTERKPVKKWLGIWS